MADTLRELARYRYLFEQMVRRELRQKYKGSVLGILWYLVNPIVLMAAYTIMFTYILKRPGTIAIHDYALFVLVGIVVWNFFQQALMAGASSLLDQGALVRRAVFPRETIPAAVVTVQMVTVCAVLVLVAIVVLIVHAGALSVWLLLVPFYLLALFVFTLGLALATSVLHAHFRDVAPILGAVLLPWFFITPIFYSAEDFPGAAHHHWIEPLLRWVNPVAPFVDSIRSAMFDGQWPGVGDTIYVVVAAAIALTAGAAIFRRLQRDLAVVV
jgi:ABC-type polysaccharide/polyol phosphate export permease